MNEDSPNFVLSACLSYCQSIKFVETSQTSIKCIKIHELTSDTDFDLTEKHSDMVKSENNDYFTKNMVFELHFKRPNNFFTTKPNKNFCIDKIGITLEKRTELNVNFFQLSCETI